MGMIIKSRKQLDPLGPNQRRLSVSAQNARIAGLWESGKDPSERIRSMARGAGLRIRFAAQDALTSTGDRFPLVVELHSGEVAVVTAVDEAGDVSLVMGGEGGLPHVLPLEELKRRCAQLVVARPARSAPDARVDTYIRPYEEHWLRRLLLKDRRSYGHVVAASLITNILGLATVLFSMQVYDRVIPAASYPTLYILFLGVVIAIGFDFLLRRLRMSIIDTLGKRADLRISDRVFGHALRVRNSDRPLSTGTFIAQLRDLEQVRELLTSTTIAAIADLPFFLLFLVLFWFIGGG
ncbi:ABC transporter transmembrane domain-containing protein [Novosphingobium panipatense]